MLYKEDLTLGAISDLLPMENVSIHDVTKEEPFILLLIFSQAKNLSDHIIVTGCSSSLYYFILALRFGNVTLHFASPLKTKVFT